MLRVSSGEGGSFFNADKRKKQVTLIDPASAQSSTAEDRRPTVAAPKMFAFDAIFTEEDSQVRYSKIFYENNTRVVWKFRGLIMKMNKNFYESVFIFQYNHYLALMHFFHLISNAIILVLKNDSSRLSKYSFAA